MTTVSQGEEPTLTLPTGRLLGIVVAAALATALAWVVVVSLVGPGRDAILPGLVGSALVTAVCAVGVITPHVLSQTTVDRELHLFNFQILGLQPVGTKNRDFDDHHCGSEVISNRGCRTGRAAGEHRFRSHDHHIVGLA